MKKKIPITYTGSDTENLYVLGIRNGREIKLKVKEIGCHGPIRVDGITEDRESYTNESSLKEAAEKGELINNTIYIINDNGDEKKYIYYNNELVPIGLAESPVDGLQLGKSFDTLQELTTALGNGSLKSKTIYTVTDKGTIEQYIIENDKLIQIAGNLNEIVSGNEENESEKSLVEEDKDGIIDYNLTELVNGNFRYKNHSNLREVYCDMPNLKSGRQMFWGCPLESFAGNLSALDDGLDMFGKNCILDYESIVNIIDSLPSYDSGTHEISIGYNSSISETNITMLQQELKAKGWVVHWWPSGTKSVKINL